MVLKTDKSLKISFTKAVLTSMKIFKILRPFNVHLEIFEASWIRRNFELVNKILN